MLVLHLSLSTYIHVYIPLQACFLGSVHFRWRRIRVNATFPAFSFLVLISQLVKVFSYTALIPWHGFKDIFSTDHISIFFFLAICIFLFCFSPKINSNVIFTIEGSDVSDKKSFMVRYGHPHAIFLHCGPAIHHTSLNNLNLNRCSKTSIEVSLSCSGLAVLLSMAVQISLDIFSINILDKLIK